VDEVRAVKIVLITDVFQAVADAIVINEVSKNNQIFVF
jgi:hypothetical protein